MEIPALTVQTEDGFVDLSLKLDSPNTANGYRFEARALYEGRPIAFAVGLGTTWQAQEVDGNSSKFLFYWGEVDLVSLGPESDAFIQALERLYQTTTGVTQMRRTVRFTAVSLAGDPSLFPAKPVKIKLFFESDEDDLCAEVYLNFDVLAKRVEFHEKDEEYRLPLILALGENLVP